MKFILIILALSLATQGMSQEEGNSAGHLPVFNGCSDRKKPQVCTSKHLQSFLSKIKYPRSAKKAKAQGKVMVSFIVDTSGSVTEIAIKESSGFDVLDNAAAEYVSEMPQWIPGKKNGKLSPIQLTVPINFKL